MIITLFAKMLRGLLPTMALMGKVILVFAVIAAPGGLIGGRAAPAALHPA